MQTPYILYETYRQVSLHQNSVFSISENFSSDYPSIFNNKFSFYKKEALINKYHTQELPLYSQEKLLKWISRSKVFLFSLNFMTKAKKKKELLHKTSFLSYFFLYFFFICEETFEKEEEKLFVSFDLCRVFLFCCVFSFFRSHRQQQHRVIQKAEKYFSRKEQPFFSFHELERFTV